jgi:nitrite reductase/ring-hydroxylating ferredoxin subunit
MLERIFTKYSWRGLIGALLMIGLVAGLTACGGATTASAEPVQAQWVQALPAGDSVTLPVADVETHRNVHFKVTDAGTTAAFMAYQGEDGITVRANVCPPCRSQGFSLAGDVLVCDTCATTFEADTGDGIQGACADFPKASVAYSIEGGNIVMTKADLFTAYRDTNAPGRP